MRVIVSEGFSRVIYKGGKGGFQVSADMSEKLWEGVCGCASGMCRREKMDPLLVCVGKLYQG